MKQINLLPWREHRNKLKIRQFVIIWFGVSCSCIILLFIAKILIIQQIKNYHRDSDGILLQIKTLSPRIQAIKQLELSSKELYKIVKIIQVNHQQIKKILDFIVKLKYLITPDIFVRFIEFDPPYLSLVMHADSKKEYLNFIQLLQFKYHSQLRWWILRNNIQTDFIVQMLFDKN